MKTLLFRESIELVILVGTLMFIFRSNNVVFLLCVVILISLGYFYRLPKRLKPNFNDTIVTAPCDGRVSEISETNDGFYKICIVLNIFDVHIQWFPVDGVVKNLIYKKGSFNLAHILEKSNYNERLSTIIQSEYGVVRLDQIAGQVARRIVNWSISNSFVKRGNLMGMIKLSSRVDIYLPKHKVKLFVKLNDTLRGKQTAIAKWVIKQKNKID
jgi:phosphatidylserine decarboxylase